MNKESIKYLVISDIHLGHKHTKNIIKHLQLYFEKNARLFKKLDMIIIAGDIFDKLLPNNSVHYLAATDWLLSLVMFCRKYDIKLRVLEGTPSHDWKQAKLIYNIIKKFSVGIDFKYYDDLAIEHIDDFGINVLYIPDEYKHKASETFKDVKKMLIEKQLTKVDIAVMHGNFNYQLPVILESSHNEEDYLNITKYYINIGHVHTSSVNDRILAQGSFDRLKHGEEEDKGGIVCTIYSNGLMEYLFIKNTYSNVYKTIDVSNYNDIKDVDNLLSKYKNNDSLRLLARGNETLYQGIKKLIEKYENLYITIDKSVIEKLEYKMEIESDKIESFSIDEKNILKLMMTEAKNSVLTQKQQKIYKEELVNILNEI